MAEQIYKIVKLKFKNDIETDFNLPATVKVFVANVDDSCNFAVNLFNNVQDNVSLASYIIEKMTRAYYEGYTDRVDEEELIGVL